MMGLVLNGDLNLGSFVFDECYGSGSPDPIGGSCNTGNTIVERSARSRLADVAFLSVIVFLSGIVGF